jgi:transposase
LIPHGVEVFVGLDLIDLRWGFNRLTGLVAEKLRRDARSGAMFVFFGKQREAMKILFFDGSGLCLFYKRLDKGTFRVPAAPIEGAAAMEISEREFDALLDGIDIETPVMKARSTRH